MNLWTQDRESSQPWSMNTFQEHINNVTGSPAAFDLMWAHMQKIIGEQLLILPFLHKPLEQPLLLEAALLGWHHCLTAHLQLTMLPCQLLVLYSTLTTPHN